MKKKIVITAFILFIGILSYSQNQTAHDLNYKTAFGLKFWDGAGLTLKTFITPKNALEFIGFFHSHATRITGLYEIHGALNTEGNLKWYIGPGAHVGFYKLAKEHFTYAGIDGVIGADYKFKDLPLNLSLDWQPAFEFGTNRGFYANWAGLAVRYTF